MTDQAMRIADLRQMLTERQRDIQDAVQSRIRDGRIDRLTDVRDDIEVSDVGTQRDISLTVLQMRAEMLARVDEALARLDLGEYGTCIVCQSEISERRLRAMPFAVRCHVCQERSEQQLERAREFARRRGHVALYADPVNS
jgi:DnaK suppressor protein